MKDKKYAGIIAILFMTALTFFTILGSGFALNEGEVISASAPGFGGDVNVDVIFEEDGVTIKKVTITAAGETEGLGAKVAEPAFAAQFTGKKLPVSETDIDAVSGATISTKAVLSAINSLSSETVPEENKEEAVTDENAVKASADGFAGPVEVTVTFEEDGVTIKSLSIKADKETPGLGQLVTEEVFVHQFVGKTADISMDEVDAVTGATISSKAVVTALNSLAGNKEQSNEEQPKEEANAVSGKAKGFGGDITVEVVFEDDNKTVKSFTVNPADETRGLGSRVVEDDFMNQFIGKTTPIEESAIDVITGATISSNAVVAAINNAAQNVK